LGCVSVKITFNGKEYDGVDAMPPDVRQDYEVLLESLKSTGGEEILSLLKGDPARASVKATFREIVVNGKKYGSLEEMPVEVRRTYEEAVARMTPGAAGGPQSVPPPAPPRPPRPSRPSLQRPPIVADDQPRQGAWLRILLWMAIGALVALWLVRYR
jgi:hypothetical protein